MKSVVFSVNGTINFKQLWLCGKRVITGRLTNRKTLLLISKPSITVTVLAYPDDRLDAARKAVWEVHSLY